MNSPTMMEVDVSFAPEGSSVTVVVPPHVDDIRVTPSEGVGFEVVGNQRVADDGTYEIFLEMVSA